ncbi:MAG TPA: hypothetical protein VHZ52_07070 [Acidobacteriaceae bacterium]|jgi:hypothetical protein|nr:hypothetical protein [Acidobacteriaceae bacterium]
MRTLKYLALTSFAAGMIFASASKAPAQVAVEIGAPPVCPYGYYEAPPYTCAPDGYYGPEWFNGGVFIGAGPWFHGHDHFYGHVDHHLDYRHGYHGPTPARGEHPAGHRAEFHGQAMHDAHGHEAPHGHPRG